MLNCGHIDRTSTFDFRLISQKSKFLVIFVIFDQKSIIFDEMNMHLIKKGQSSHLLQGFNHLQQQNIPFWYMKKLFYLKIWLESEMVKNK